MYVSKNFNMVILYSKNRFYVVIFRFIHFFNWFVTANERVFILDYVECRSFSSVTYLIQIKHVKILRKGDMEIKIKSVYIGVQEPKS